MLLDLFIIGVAITLGPLHNTGFILILTADRGVRKGLAFILAWLACLVVVIALVLLGTGGTPPRPHTVPSSVAEAVKLAIGLALICFGEYKRRKAAGKPRTPPTWLGRLHDVSAWTAAGFGIFLQPWGMVAAAAAIVVGAKVSSVASYLALMGFCLLASASILVMELCTAFAPEAAGRQLDRVRVWLDDHTDQAVVVISLLAGLWLVSKSIYQLVT
ncbi:GAP family protein [Streptacidiphilus fuscans]|uniref:GAP family protein n=1 Tax=Streptacidiphilus fuscans TaxID=2789292 RepID=A0A931BG05_9ACTN|nr:GAP family protein [Streptacidiphilus fuscans]MBF9069878.1 GAP family protein [Streptacidiphilus fuscans]MBF9073448.1 GAP family protein [Streptacidiphilus fuscans]